MMDEVRILHLLSQHHDLTGSEVYAATLSHAQTTAGHEVRVVSGHFNTDFTCQKTVLPLEDRRILQRLKNIRSLRRLIRVHRIDIVHAHSRAASWVGYFATRFSSARLVSTIHGEQHLHFSSKNFSVYGEALIAISPWIKNHLIRDLRISEEKIFMIPNPFPIESFKQQRKTRALEIGAEVVIGLAGRVSGPKGQRMYDFLHDDADSLMQFHPNLRIKVIGIQRSGRPSHIESEFIALQSRYSARMAWSGVHKSLVPILRKCDGVIASGRIALEALLLGVPVYARGEARDLGPIFPENFNLGVDSNFGDIGLQENIQSSSAQGFREWIRGIQDGSHYQRTQQLFGRLQKNYDLEHIAEQVEKIYRVTARDKAKTRKLD